MASLVERLRNLGGLPSYDAISADLGVHTTLHEAADRITALEASTSHWMGEAQRLLKSGQDALDRVTTLEAELAAANVEAQCLREMREIAQELGFECVLTALEGVSDLRDRITALEALCETLAEALEFYSAESGWNEPPVKTVAHEILGPAYENQASLIRRDRGKIARQALTQYRAMKEKSDG